MKSLLGVLLLATFIFGGAVAQSATAPTKAAQPMSDAIATAAPVYRALAALEGGERFPQGAQLLRIHAGKATPLVAGFYATADAQVSFRGDAVLFAARPTAADHWQIWEQPLPAGAPRKLFAGAEDAIRPLYLPLGQFVFALHTASGFQLQVAGKGTDAPLARIADDAGATLLQLSHVPGNAIPDDVLHDGRILFESVYPMGAGKTPEMYLVYSDGSGVESYRCDHGVARWGGHQMSSGDVVFTHGPTLARFNSPLAHEVPIAAPHADYAGGIVEMPAGSWLLSARSSPAGHYGLRIFKPGAAAAQQSLFALTDRDVAEPVVVAPRTRPNYHPSAVHPWNYANQLALDARIGRDGNLAQTPARVRLETLDSAGRVVANGTAPIESDGSFFVQTPADRAIRFVLLDAEGRTVRQQEGWFWIRAGEQRICVGCHAGPERSPDNRVPEVLLKTTTPVNLTGHAAQNAAEAPGGK
jgi:hypothetical protein